MKSKITSALASIFAVTMLLIGALLKILEVNSILASILLISGSVLFVANIVMSIKDHKTSMSFKVALGFLGLGATQSLFMCIFAATKQDTEMAKVYVLYLLGSTLAFYIVYLFSKKT
jgi:hypothetical protein